MKKLVILVLFSLIGLTTMAQSLPINIGIHGGWNDAKIKAKEYKIDSHGGYMIGAFARINLGSIYLEPALNLHTKKVKSMTKSVLSENSNTVPSTSLLWWDITFSNSPYSNYADSLVPLHLS